MRWCVARINVPSKNCRKLCILRWCIRDYILSARTSIIGSSLGRQISCPEMLRSMWHNQQPGESILTLVWSFWPGRQQRSDEHVVPLYVSVSRDRRRCPKRGKRTVETLTTSCTRGRRQPSTHSPSRRSSRQKFYWRLHWRSRRLIVVNEKMLARYFHVINREHSWIDARDRKMLFGCYKNCPAYMSHGYFSISRNILWKSSGSVYPRCVKLIKQISSLKVCCTRKRGVYFTLIFLHPCDINIRRDIWWEGWKDAQILLNI